MPTNDADLIIAGAGLSGLGLACDLRERGFAGSMIVVDRRRDFERDQRWCTWGPVEPSLVGLESHAWNRWQVIGEGSSRRFHLAERPYVEFKGARLLGSFAKRLANSSPAASLRLGVDVRGFVNRMRWAEVETSEGTLRGRWVVDARGADGAILAGSADAGGVWLWQSFVGFTVATDAAAFEPGRVTLMDFRTPQEDAAEFFYVLPYSSTCALVECTVVDRVIWPLDRYREHLAWYLARIGLAEGQWRVTSEEVGAIPMTTRRFPHRSEGAVIPLGVAAGAAKPSTGYGFARTRRQVRAVSSALMRGLPPQTPRPAARGRMLDTVLLNVVAAHPEQFRRGMLRLFERVDAATIVRFLSEESSLLDDLRVASVVGSMKFAQAAARIWA